VCSGPPQASVGDNVHLATQSWLLLFCCAAGAGAHVPGVGQCKAVQPSKPCVSDVHVISQISSKTRHTHPPAHTTLWGFLGLQTRNWCMQPAPSAVANHLLCYAHELCSHPSCKHGRVQSMLAQRHVVRAHAVIACLFHTYTAGYTRGQPRWRE
jgi:hypothetical protein